LQFCTKALLTTGGNIEIGKVKAVELETKGDQVIFIARNREKTGGAKNFIGKYFVRCRPVGTRNIYITPENRKILWERSLELSGL
jgi:hypothetical protein